MLILAQLRKCQVMGRLAALRLQILVVWALHEQRGGVEARRWSSCVSSALRLQILVVWGDLEKWERMIIFADNFEF